MSNSSAIHWVDLDFPSGEVLQIDYRSVEFDRDHVDPQAFRAGPQGGDQRTERTLDSSPLFWRDASFWSRMMTPRLDFDGDPKAPFTG